MKINSFRAEGVHDHLDFNVNFFSNLTFLIGINGAGKTSVLKLILGLTSPSFHFLNQIRYRFCEVVCSSNELEMDIVIRAVQDDEMFSIFLTTGGVTHQAPPVKRFLKKDAFRQYDADDLVHIEQRMRQEFDTLDVSKKIRALTAPKFLGLDRRIYEGVNLEVRRRNSTLRYATKKFEGFHDAQAIDVSLDEARILSLIIFDRFLISNSESAMTSNQNFSESILSSTMIFYTMFGPLAKCFPKRKSEFLKQLATWVLIICIFPSMTFSNEPMKLQNISSVTSYKERQQNIAMEIVITSRNGMSIVIS